MPMDEAKFNSGIPINKAAGTARGILHTEAVAAASRTWWQQAAPDCCIASRRIEA